MVFFKAAHFSLPSFTGSLYWFLMITSKRGCYLFFITFAVFSCVPGLSSRKLSSGNTIVIYRKELLQGKATQDPEKNTTRLCKGDSMHVSKI